MKPIYLLIGTPGSGKTWCMDQLKDKYNVLAHDKKDEHGNYYRFTDDEYIRDIDGAARTGHHPVLCETPFSISNLYEPLTKLGHDVRPVFIIEHPNVTAQRYFVRENKAIPKGHLTRIETYKQRAKEMKAKVGTSAEILIHLKGL